MNISKKNLAFALSCSFLVFSAQSKTINRSMLRPFAKSFNCKNPNLQWQFDNLITTFEENTKAGNRKKIKTFAKDVGGNKDWLYRGVTNRQFNESQILGLIFNDTTTVSESRWFSGDMFSHAHIAKTENFVTQRANYQNLEFSKRWDAFKHAFEKTKKTIENLVDNKSSGGISDFDEHIRVGSSFNGTPQAIQFLTPHIAYAEGYGEYVLHIKETIQRGIDVERYNYHHPNWSYKIGSIYSMDRDEYMVPSHIPQWDVQIIKVRNGTGWHKRDYGAPIYYYTKIYEKNNPCNVIGVRVDAPDSRGVDKNRIPVGMLLKCEKGKKCHSSWDNAVGKANQDRLKAVVESTKIDDRGIYYVPYALYQSGDKKFLEAQSLATILSFYPHLKKNIINDLSFWKKIILGNYKSDPQSAIKLTKKNKLINTFISEWRRDALKFINNSKFKPAKKDLDTVMDFALFLKLLPSKKIENAVLSYVKNPGDRLGLVTMVNQRSNEHQFFKDLAKKLRQELVKLDDLSPTLEVTILQTSFNESNPALIQAVAKGLSKEAGFATQYWTIVDGDDNFKYTLLEDALKYIMTDPNFELVDSFQTFQELDPYLKNVAGRENILGLCIDYAIGSYKMPAFTLAEKVGTLELPKDREIDTIRSLWGYAKNEIHSLGDTPTNKYKFVASSLRYSIANSVHARADMTEEDRARHTRAFNQFYWEFVSPPAPVLSFAALNSFRKITGKDDLIFIWPTEDKVKVKISETEEYEVDRVHLEAILGQSLSGYYLWQIKSAYDYETDVVRKKSIRETIKTVISKYREYILNGLEDDLKDEKFTELIQSQFKMNDFEDLSSVIFFVAHTTSNSVEKNKILTISNNVKKMFKGMTGKMLPLVQDPNDKRKVSQEWLNILK